MIRIAVSVGVACTLAGASITSADVTVSGAIYYSNTPGEYLAQYAAGPLGSIGRGVTYERFNSTESTLGATASGGGPGFIFSRSFVQYRLNQAFPDNPSGFGLNANSVADAVWSDIVVSGPSGPASVPFSINVLLDGFDILGSIGGVGGTSANTYASFNARINGVVAATGNYVRTVTGGGPTQTPIADGVFAGFDGSAAFETDAVMVPVNTPFSISVQLQTYAHVDATYTQSGTTSALMNFGDTASLATTGPAFNVPAGYTVNSAAAGVTNNVFLPCFCDWDHDGTVGSQDFFDFLARFFAADADFNHDGTTGSQDFFDFLACFFSGC